LSAARGGDSDLLIIFSKILLISRNFGVKQGKNDVKKRSYKKLD
jgi:hypothetical protein